MGIKEILEKLGVNQEEFKTLRSYLINKSDICFLSGNICYIEESKEEIKEINDITEKLEEYIWNNFEEVDFDYHENTEKGCYFLSILFSLTSTWNLAQGRMIDDLGKDYYHSWCYKDNLIYDPSMRVVTTKEKYEKFFICEDEYTKEEVKSLLKQTGTFTHFKYDLKEGKINPFLYTIYYNTDMAKIAGENILEKLDEKVGLKEDNLEK